MKNFFLSILVMKGDFFMQNYQVVPNIISSKDLDYLSDMFEWNCGALKETTEAANKANSEDIKTTLQKAANLFNKNISIILDILQKGGSNE